MKTYFVNQATKSAREDAKRSMLCRHENL